MTGLEKYPLKNPKIIFLINIPPTPSQPASAGFFMPGENPGGEKPCGHSIRSKTDTTLIFIISSLVKSQTIITDDTDQPT
jgi:hypothetical protein